MSQHINEIDAELRKLKESAEEYKIDNHKAYLIFTLGYDQAEVLEKLGLACDVAFDLCHEVIMGFKKSKIYKDSSISEYDALQIFVNENFDRYFKEEE